MLHIQNIATTNLNDYRLFRRCSRSRSIEQLLVVVYVRPSFGDYEPINY